MTNRLPQIFLIATLLPLCWLAMQAVHELWNGLGPHFGLGAAAGKVDARPAYACCGLLILTVILELALGSR